jgi:hypothetical protein
MATEAEIKKAILKVAGNPESGPIRDWAPILAKAIAELDSPPLQSAKETRVIAVEETR